MTHPDEGVVRDLEKCFVPVKLDTGRHGERARALEIRWLPGQVVLQPGGRVEHRWIGFLGPASYRVELLFARAMNAMDTKAYEEADRLFGELVEGHPESARAREACYWWGISEQRRHRDSARAVEKWRILVDRYPDDVWTEKVGWMV